MSVSQRHLQEALQCVLDAPEDDVPRLVYADLLVQNGDPRGEFIRTQCALSGADITHTERKALRKTADALLAKHQALWLEQAGLSKGAEDVVWLRGFVDRVTVSGEPFAGEQGAKLLAREPIKALTLKFNSSRVARLIANAAHFHQVRELTLTGPIGDEQIETLFSATAPRQLRALNVGSTKMTGGGLRFIAQEADFASLERLSLSGCDLLGEFAVILTDEWKLPALHTLYATRTGMDDDDLLALSNHPSLAGLTTLTITKNEYGERPVTALLSSPSISSLRLLELDAGDSPSPAILSALIACEYLTSLRSLKLNTRYWTIAKDTRVALENKFGRGLRFGN
jgi:uncharacterized protein (TIGR02996 family)